MVSAFKLFEAVLFKITDLMKRVTFLMLCLSFSLSALAQNESDKILGVWFNTEKDAKIEIYKCGDKYCGKIVWLKTPNYEDGTPKIDKNNPDDRLKKRPIMGLNLLSGFEYVEDGEWEEGTIYDPKEGKTYSCVITFKDAKTLNVRGYIGFSLMGKTVLWTRAE